MFLTTHFMDEAQHLADRVAIMRDGRDHRRSARPDELGGRDVRPAEIRFVLPAGLVARRPAASCPTERCSIDGDRVLVQTREPVAALPTC